MIFAVLLFVVARGSRSFRPLTHRYALLASARRHGGVTTAGYGPTHAQTSYAQGRASPKEGARKASRTRRNACHEPGKPLIVDEFEAAARQRLAARGRVRAR